MIKVQVRPNEPLESALRRFKRQCNYAGIFKLAKKYSFFEKRSDRRRREGRERLRSIKRAGLKVDSIGRRDRGGRRRSKMRASSVTPESARLSAAAAAAAADPVINPEMALETRIAGSAAVANTVTAASPSQEIGSAREIES